MSELQTEENYEKLKECELFILDMDGTLYLGDDVFEGAVDFIHTLERTGKQYIYLTNNSSRAGADYIGRLRRLGFPCEKENVFTSGMATGLYLQQNYPGKKCCVVGTKAFREELERYGTQIDDENAEVVVVGFDTELVYHELERAVHFLRRGAPFIAANPDWVCPMPHDEVLPDCGSICALLTASSGVEPFYIGKPNRNIVDVIAKERRIHNSRICCVGDRLYTDIAVAQNAETVSVLVLSGETDEKMVRETERKPSYVLSDVRAISAILEGRDA
ncbi:HAD-IIA family hydrolase [[Clostridium] aminophilum]|uniref:HAD-IIA family hydrolase n=1 Tax=[Clostridium] aminophilum TaxID=1526 RepID=UPI003F9BE4C5